MPSIAPYTAGSYANVGRTGSGAWSGTIGSTFFVPLGPGGGAPPFAASDFIVFTAWGPSPNVPPYVPANAEDIVVRFKFSKSTASGTAVIKDDTVQPLHNGSDVGSNLAATGANWPSSATDSTYDCGSYTAAQINSGLLGLRIGATAYGSPGDVSFATISTPVIESITWTVPGKIGTCGGDVGDEDGYGSDNLATFDDSSTAMIVGTSSGVQKAVFVRLHLGTDIATRIPPHAEISTASLTFYDHGGGAVPVLVCATDSAQETAPTDATDLWTKISGSLSTAQIPWTIASSSPSEPYPTIDTPDLADLLQELIQRFDYNQADSDILFLLIPNSASDVHTLGTKDGSEGAYLSVAWSYTGDIVPGDPGAVTFRTATFFLFVE